MRFASSSSIRRRRRRRMSSTTKILFAVCFLVATTCFLFLFQLNYTIDNLQNQGISKKKKNAYVFVLAGCDPSRPSYLGPLLNILVATYVLKHQFTTSSPAADVVVLIQMSFSSTAASQKKLPDYQEDWLQRLGIQLRYLPPPGRTLSFYELIAQKLQAFQLIEYDRVMVLDTDVLPLCSLEYVFSLFSGNDIILHAMYDDPVNAGLFVVSPSRQAYQQLQQIIQQQSPDMSLPPPHWDSNKGWGTSSLKYRLWNDNSTATIPQHSGWDFYCANSDQGLLLYWAKYVQQQHPVSIIAGTVIEHSFPNKNGTIAIEHNTLERYSCLPPSGGENNNLLQNTFAANASPRASQLGFYRDFYHAVGLTKPWEMYDASIPNNKNTIITSTNQYWHVLLERVVTEFQLANVPQGGPALSKAIPPPLDRGDLFAIGKTKEKGAK
jgi:hypothetical protein